MMRRISSDTLAILAMLSTSASLIFGLLSDRDSHNPVRIAHEYGPLFAGAFHGKRQALGGRHRGDLLERRLLVIGCLLVN